MNRPFLLFSMFFVITGIYSQQIENVDFVRIHADLAFSNDKQVSGTVEVQFKMLKDMDSIYLDAVNMTFSDVGVREFADNATNSSHYRVDSTKIVVWDAFKKNSDYVLRFSYKAHPRKALYFVDGQVWTQGQGKYTSNWLPSIDDMNDKIEFDLSISALNGVEVVANGQVVKKELLDQGRTKWHYDMSAPMSSYLVALVMGKYDKRKEISESGIPLEYYYYPKDSAKVESTFRYSKHMFDFFEDEIGFPYPWKVYRQIPVKDFLYSGMENTTLTIFSDALVVDAIGFNDRNYVNVNAHELAHQWFGDLVTEAHGTHHWLQEGFATFYALLAEREIFGEDYYYWRLYEYAQQLLEQENAGESTALLNPNSSSLTFYQKGCWALHILREQVGDAAFKQAVKTYLTNHQFQNVVTQDFIEAVESTIGTDLIEFESVWLEEATLPQDAMVKSLKTSEFIREYLDVSCEAYPLKCNDYLRTDISDKAKIKILTHPSYQVKPEDFNNGWEVRQAIAQKLTTIPAGFKTVYESLLKDPSYLTREAALYNLWVNFPLDRVKYLTQTKNEIGFSDYNIRLLWLALHLNTIEYQPDKKTMIFEELKSYTYPQYSFELRTNAFEYLKLIGGFDQESITNLLEATQHHNWRFVQFAKRLLLDLENVASYKSIIDTLK